MRKKIHLLLRSIMAGIAIGIGGTAYLSSSTVLMGAFLFAIGLLLIVSCDYSLFTSRVGYLVENKRLIFDLIIIWIGNLIGTFVVGTSLILTRFDKIAKANMLVDIKLSDSLLSLLVLSIFCGMLMFYAYDSFNKVKHEIGKYLILIFSVMVFIIAGFEHSIANMFYFALTKTYSFKTLGVLGIITFGNALGGLFVCYLNNQLKIKEGI